MTDYRFNLYILTSLAAHIICASFLLLSKAKLYPVETKIDEMVNIVLHQSVKPFTVKPEAAVAKPKTIAAAPSESAAVVTEKVVNQNTLQKNAASDGGEIGRLAKNLEEVYIAELKYDLEKRKKYPVMAKKWDKLAACLCNLKLIAKAKLSIAKSSSLRRMQALMILYKNYYLKLNLLNLFQKKSSECPGSLFYLLNLNYNRTSENLCHLKNRCCYLSV